MQKLKAAHNEGRQKRRAQAVVELAIFGALILLVFNMILTFGQRLDNTQRAKMEAFRKALRTSYYRNAGTSYTLKRDSRIVDANSGFFQGQASTSGASASVMWVKGMPGEQENLDLMVLANPVKGLAELFLGMNPNLEGHPEGQLDSNGKLKPRTHDDIRLAQSFSYYQVNDETLGDDYGLPMYRKTVQKQHALIDLTAVLSLAGVNAPTSRESWVPIGVGSEQSFRSTHYSSSAMKAEVAQSSTPGITGRAIVNKKTAKLNDVVTTSVFGSTGRLSKDTGVGSGSVDTSLDCVGPDGTPEMCAPDITDQRPNDHPQYSNVAEGGKSVDNIDVPSLSQDDGHYKNAVGPNSDYTFRHGIDRDSPNAQFTYTSKTPITDDGNAPAHMTDNITVSRTWTTQEAP